MSMAASSMQMLIRSRASSLSRIEKFASNPMLTACRRSIMIRDAVKCAAPDAMDVLVAGQRFDPPKHLA